MARLALALVLGSCAAGPRAIGRTAERAADELERDDRHAAVVFLTSDCSGVLVAPDRLLTAAHCVAGERPFVRGDAGPIAIAECTPHPDASPGATRCEDVDGDATVREHDLAIAVLATPIDAVPMRVMLTSPYVRDDWWRGGRVTLVGWQRRPTLVGEARRYSGANALLSVDGALVTTAPFEAGGFRTRAGSSGGPALVTIDGVEWVIGILFGGTAPSSAESVFASTLDPTNAAWLVRAGAVPDELEGRDFDRRFE